VLVHEHPWVEPEALCALLRARSTVCVWLDSALPDARLGRHSYVCADPFLTLESRDGRVGLGRRRLFGDPLAVFGEHLRRFRLPHREGLPPFQGGAVACLAYELGHHLERVPTAERDPLPFPDLIAAFFDLVFAFDQLSRRLYVLSTGLPESDPAARQQRAEVRLRQAREWLGEVRPLAPVEGCRWPIAIRSDFTREAFERAIQRVVDYIHAGDVFQANLAQRFHVACPAGLDPFTLYRRLRTVNPAPFAALLLWGERAIASASPERFLKLEDGRVETRPIKGTRPRAREDVEDRRLARELVESEKDRAENVMIVDLLRNDLSKVCRDGSVEVPELCTLESFAHVHHLVSTVRGVLRPGCDAVDLLRAAFPGGSITGAPKIRAMEIIAELEPVRRGPYCGSIAWLGFSGWMDSSIVIRTLVMRRGQVQFHVGGGIVADSVPAAEYEETLAKAEGLLRALRGWR